MRSLLIILLILASLSVLLGCVAKIQHWPVANYLLGAGLITEMACAIAFVAGSVNRRRSAGR